MRAYGSRYEMRNEQRQHYVNQIWWLLLHVVGILIADRRRGAGVRLFREYCSVAVSVNRYRRFLYFSLLKYPVMYRVYDLLQNIFELIALVYIPSGVYTTDVYDCAYYEAALRKIHTYCI